MTKPQTTRRPFPVLAIGFGVLVALALVVALVAALGGGGGRDGGPAEGVSETRPVTVDGQALAPDDGARPDPAVGRPAPAISGASSDGQPVSILNDGRAKLVMFVAHWCPHCRAEVPRVVQWTAAGAGQGVDLYAVSTGVNADAPNYPPSSWLEREGWTVPTVADDKSGTAADAWGLTGFPYFVAVRPDGTVAARASGELDRGQFDALVAAAHG
ncbi:MAG TPA: TlpA disulfide reductase family protein [Acidimicrobiales bacterium]|nr:TlpA disulfide reductase family protein [Acidimicrobiales bacterium]